MKITEIKTILREQRSLKPCIPISLLTRLLLCLVTLISIAHADVPAPVVAQPSTCQPERLRCEYLVDPLGLDVPHPRLDWILTGTSETPRNLSQSSYHILVASSPENLAQDRGDLWDSGDVKSDETSFIVYAGSDLKSRETCYWKVRVTDSLGGVSVWSKPALWEMGLLKPDDWKAKWISAPMMVQTQANQSSNTLSIVLASYEATDGGGAKNVTDLVKGMVKDNALSVRAGNDTFESDPAFGHTKQLRLVYTMNGEKHEATAAEGVTLNIPVIAIPYLRKDFTLAKPIAKARVYATALGLYELRLNGQRVGDHVFAPDWTAYDKRVRYQVYDVTSLVKQGANTLASLVDNGWFCGPIAWFGSQKYGKIPALLTQLEVTYADGSTETIVTDTSWKLHAGPIISSDLQVGEDYDARQEIAGWDQPGLDVSDWVAATERPESRSLEEQMDQPVREIGEIHPKSMTNTDPNRGQWTFDLGQNMVGVVRIKVSAPTGTKITLRHAEMLNPNGTLNTASLRGAPATDTYICNGNDMETWQPRFTYHGFRYVELTGLPEAPGDDTVTGIVIGTDIPHTGKFSCSNPDVNQLQSNIQWTMWGNYLSIPTGCAQRAERIGWMGDAEFFVHTAAYNGDIAAFITKWMVDVDDTQAQVGGSMFTDVSPDPGATGGGAPGWADAGVICPWTIYMMYGDKRILEQNLPAMMRWVDWCKASNADLIRVNGRWGDYGDWLSQGEDTSKELIGTAFFAYSTELVAKACEVTGDAAGAAKYKQLFEQIKTAFNQRYVSADGHIQGGTQCAYCMALRFNLLPDDLRPLAGQYLEDDVKAHQNHLATGFIGAGYLLPALCSQNKVDTAYRVFLQETLPSWLFSVKHGATTIWECWDGGWTPEKGFQASTSSFNQYALGSCGEWMFDSVAGIGVDIDQPGFKHIIIHPRPGGKLTHAEGSFDSIHGKISTSWTMDSGEFSLHIVIPVNTTATVYLPVANPSSVQEGGHAVATLPEIKILPAGQDGSQFLIGSGDYNFTCQMP